MKRAVPILTCLALFFAFVTVERYVAYRVELKAMNEIINDVDTATIEMANAFDKLGSVMGSSPKRKYKPDNRIKPGFPPVCIYSSLFSIVCGIWAGVMFVKAKREEENRPSAADVKKTADAIDLYFS